MTERKFTPPTEFPAEYVNGFGDQITLLAKGFGLYPYAGQDGNGDWSSYGEDGSLYADGSRSKDDLHDIPKKPKTHKIVFYVNVFKNGDYQVYSSRAFADQYLDAMPYRIACKRIEIEVTEGEFDE